MEKTVCCLGFCSFFNDHVRLESLHQSFGSLVPLEKQDPWFFKSSDNRCATTKIRTLSKPHGFVIGLLRGGVQGEGVP